MAKSHIRERIEQNVTIWLLGTLLTGFLSGIGVYRAIQDIAGLKILSATDLEISKRQLAELAQKLEAAEKRAATAAVQVRQAYWAVRGTQVIIVYVERSFQAAVEIKERLAGVGALVTLRALDESRWDPKRAGKLFYLADNDREAAMQIKALVSDIALFYPEGLGIGEPGQVVLWLAEK